MRIRRCLLALSTAIVVASRSRPRFGGPSDAPTDSAPAGWQAHDMPNLGLSVALPRDWRSIFDLTGRPHRAAAP